MKYKALRAMRLSADASLAVPLVAALLLAPAWAQRAPGTTRVYQPDGTRHCDKSPGVPTDELARDLARHGIRVLSHRRSHDGREGVALCGKPTGGIHVFEIRETDRAGALELGFRPLDPSWPAPGSR